MERERERERETERDYLSVLSGIRGRWEGEGEVREVVLSGIREGEVRERWCRSGRYAVSRTHDTMILAAYGAGVTSTVWTLVQRRIRHEGRRTLASASSSKYCCSLKDIESAARRIAEYVHKTPILTCGDLDEKAGAKLFFKCELFQKTGSFKIRGAANACFSLSDEKAKRGLVTHSSGNHAQAVAYAAKCRSIPAYIVMPNNAPLPKKNAVVQTYAAHVYECEPTNEAREKLAEAKRKEFSAELIHPSAVAAM